MHHCECCNNTGEARGDGYLDCGARGCTAARDRAELNEFVSGLRGLTIYETWWAIHQRAVAITEKACEDRIAAQTLVVRLPAQS